MPNMLMEVIGFRWGNGKTTNTKGANTGLELLTASVNYFGLGFQK